MRNVYFERLVIKMFDGATYEDQVNLVKEMKVLLTVIDPNLKYQLNFITQANPA